MKKVSNVLTFFKQLSFMMLCVAVTNCAGDDEMLPSEETVQPVVEVKSAQIPEVPNYTVSGSFTEYAEAVDCSSCTFTVAEDAGVVDGKKEKIGPGSIVCIKAGVAYKSLEFVNIEGTAEKPVVIGLCGN